MNSKRWKLLRKVCRTAGLDYELWKKFVREFNKQQKEDFFKEAKRNLGVN